MAFTWSTSTCIQNMIRNVNVIDQDRLAWACLDLGIKNITHKNYREFYRRLRVRAKLFDIYEGLTIKEVFNCIGLVTSCEKEWTKSEFHKRTLSMFDKEIEREVCLGQAEILSNFNKERG